MFNFISEQIEKIFELYEQETRYTHRFEQFNQILKIIGNILFVVVCFILAWKGLVYLFEYFFPPSSSDSTVIWVRSFFKTGIVKSPVIIAAIISVLIVVVRIVVRIKHYISPLQLVSIWAMAILIKKIWEIAFSNDSESYVDFLKKSWDKFLQ
jgi:hypothetical protein